MARKKKNIGSSLLTTPETREEHYLAKIAGLVNTKPEYPITRIERYLDAIADSSGFSPTEAQLAAMNSGIALDSFNFIANKVLFGNGGNLLVNSDFRSPINRRGLTDYLGSTATVDGWYCTSAAMTTSVKSGFIRWTRDDVTTNPYLRQKVKLNPGTYTFSMLYRTNVADSDKYHFYFILGSDREIPNANGDTWHLYTKTITTQNTSEYIGIQDLSAYLESAAVDDYIDILAMYFEPGSISTLAYEDSNGYHIAHSIMPYDIELERCNKYLYIIEATGAENIQLATSMAQNTTSMYWNIFIPDMVQKPSISVTASNIIVGTSTFTSGSPTNVNPYSYSSGVLVIETNGYSDLTTGQAYRIGLKAGGKIVFSAEN